MIYTVRNEGDLSETAIEVTASSDCWSGELSMRQVARIAVGNRCVVNQCASGAVIIHTLRYVMGVTELLWDCPECTDVDPKLQSPLK